MNAYAKAIVACITAGLIAAQTAIADGRITTSDWITIALAAVGAIAVYAVPNATPPLQPAPGKHERDEHA